MTKIKKIITAAIAALALATASLAIPGQAFAGGHGHGGHGGHGGTVEATAITGTTGMAMVIIMIMVIVITAIAIISTFTTAAGNGAPTARSMSATAITDFETKKRSSLGPRARASFFDAKMITVIVCLGTATNLVASASACRTARSARVYQYCVLNYRVLKSTILAPPAAPTCIRDSRGDLPAPRYARSEAAVRSRRDLIRIQPALEAPAR